MTRSQAHKRARAAARATYDKTGKDQRFWVYIIREEVYAGHPPTYSYVSEIEADFWVANPDDLKIEVFYGTGGYDEPPTFEEEYYE